MVTLSPLLRIIYRHRLTYLNRKVVPNKKVPIAGIISTNQDSLVKWYNIMDSGRMKQNDQWWTSQILTI